MANPQKEKGYTAIANEIMEALARIRINGEARQVLDVIFRKTYGFSKKSDQISLSQFHLKTGLKRPTICKAINKLKNMNLIIITQKDNAEANIFIFNKDFDTWKALPKKITLPKKIMAITQKDNETLPKKIHTKVDNTKATITKAKATPKRREDIDILLKGIRDITGIIDGSQREQRNFAKNFIDCKTPEILRRSGNLNPTLQQIINATLRLFQLAKKDSFHQKNCTSLKYVYNKAGAIVMSSQPNKPKIAIIS